MVQKNIEFIYYLLRRYSDSVDSFFFFFFFFNWKIYFLRKIFINKDSIGKCV